LIQSECVNRPWARTSTLISAVQAEPKSYKAWGKAGDAIITAFALPEQK
jgi:hypothetical protein